MARAPDGSVNLPEHKFAMIEWEIHWSRQIAGMLHLEITEAQKMVEEGWKPAEVALKETAEHAHKLYREFEIRREIAVHSTPNLIRADRMHSIFTIEVQERLAKESKDER